MLTICKSLYNIDVICAHIQAVFGTFLLCEKSMKYGQYANINKALKSEYYAINMPML